MFDEVLEVVVEWWILVNIVGDGEFEMGGIVEEWVEVIEGMLEGMDELV